MTVLVSLALLAALALGRPAGADSRPIEERTRAEVVELHEFLEEWSNAELPASADAFARFADVIAPAFVIIDPDGSSLGREPIVEAIRNAHGRWKDAPGGIRIENFELRFADGELELATYEEWQDVGDGRGRLSTVLFGADPSAPNGLVWLHLHEVWLDPRD